MRVEKARKWRVQAHWTYEGQPRSYHPTFADSEDDAIKRAAEYHETLGHPALLES